MPDWVRNAVDWVRADPAKAAAVVWLVPLPLALVNVVRQPIWVIVLLGLFTALLLYVGYRLWTRPTRFLSTILLVLTVGAQAWEFSQGTPPPWWSLALDVAFVVLLIMALRKLWGRQETAPAPETLATP